MPINRVDEATSTKRWADYWGENEPPRPQRIVNTGPALGLQLPEFVEFAAVLYAVPPVPWEAGQELLELKQRLEDAEGGSHHERAVLRRLVKVYGSLVHPRGRLRRAFWWITRNPFRYASDGEIGQLLVFFSGCRMKSRVRYPENQGNHVRLMQ